MKTRLICISTIILFALSCTFFTPSTPSSSSNPPASSSEVDALSGYFTNVSSIALDNFNYTNENQAPDGWKSDYAGSLKITKNGEFQIQPTGDTTYGMAFFYSRYKISHGKGIFFKFKFSGAQPFFTLGFDALDESGKLMTGSNSNFCSVAMELAQDQLAPHIIDKKTQYDLTFQGNLKLEVSTWYYIAMGLDGSDNYVVRVWKSGAPNDQLVFVKNWPGLPDSYVFISYIDKNTTLLLDDFTVFQFDSINQ